MDVCESCVTKLAKICDLKHQAFKIMIFGRRFSQTCSTVFFYQVQYTLFSVFRRLLCVQSVSTCTEYYVTLQGEYWFTYHVKENACPFCCIQYANIFLFPFLFVSFYLWVAVNLVSFPIVLTVIVGHSFFTHSFYGKTIFSARRHLTTKKCRKQRESIISPINVRRKKILLLR